MRLASKARHALATTLCAICLPGGTAAQSGPGSDDQHRGPWWAVTLSAASARITCDICQPSRDLGPSLDVVVGTYTTPALRFGIEGGMWTHRDGEVRESVYRAGLLVQHHPRPGSGLHLLAGLGWSGYRAQRFHYDAARLSLGAGWDYPLGGDWVVGNSVTLDAASFGSIKNGSALIARDVGLSVVRFGVYVRRH